MKFTLEDVFIYLDYIALGEEAKEILEHSGDKISQAVNKPLNTGVRPDQWERILAAIAKADDVNNALKREAERCKEIYRTIPDDDEVIETVIEAICHRVLSEEISGVHIPANERFEISVEELFIYFDHEAQEQFAETRVDSTIYDALFEELGRCRRIYRVLPRFDEIIDELLFAICRAKGSKPRVNAYVS
ncbi:MAG: hypothetical protein J1F63_06720 [Oscillospiraceae bacterium]|nr:hypothetical protein [Oscillospiraceae bacterium]